ncbi:hypothetical protein FPZ42_08210 [Mucilaginibacter achroorhodeus]|uniref:Uncharacterized protein n=1 Tax=Mucilaginibacter achroorhodeus TaxID=2599294 RepID=A0A563U6N7_9SPHI|nr:hypothetical protein [Mucilaginibacter achroorhodeus]TWR27008.1 hypothetical protein FPZ42_08210 [Mucilaginibacter achroorhodeus]
MTHVTEKDVLGFLENKITHHVREIHRIKEIISAINDNYLESMEATSSMLEGLSSELLAIGHQRQVAKTPGRYKPLVIPESYRPQLSLSLKIAFVLSKINAGVKDEIASHLMLLQPELQLEPLIKHLSTVLSDLKSKNLLATIKDGRRYRYSLVQNSH